MRLFKALVVVAVLAGALGGTADAGTVGVTGTVKGAGAMISVEGGPYTCNLTNDYNQNALSSCGRQTFGAAFEAWVWFKAVPSTVPAGNWSFAGWSGCDELRTTANGVECAVHSGSLSLDERNPIAVFIDVLSPDLSVTANPSGAVVTSTLTNFTFATSDPTASFRCRVDTAAVFTACASGSYGFPDGPHTFRVIAVDPSGHTSFEYSRAFTVDTIAPVVSITAGPANGSVQGSTTATFQYSAPETVQFFCSLDGAPATSCGGPGITAASRGFPGLSNGVHTFAVYATDSRLTGPTVVRAWTVDTVPPTAPSFAAGPAVPTASTSAAFTFTGPVDAASFRCSLDGAPATACTSPVFYSSLAQGAHTVAVTALDSAGNESGAVTRGWSVDTVAPVAPSITSTTRGAASVSLAWADSTDVNGPVAYDVFLDGTKVATTSLAAFTIGNLVCGHGYLAGIEAVDGLGNRSLRTSVVLAAVPCPDRLAPNTRMLRGPSARTTSHSATFRFASTEAGTFQCKLDRGRWAACKSPKAYRSLKKGLHTFQVRARDRAGNLDATPAKKSWRIR